MEEQPAKKSILKNMSVGGLHWANMFQWQNIRPLSLVFSYFSSFNAQLFRSLPGNWHMKRVF